ncbi:hypothetical protein TREMEDRAFT_64184 [Tremella mesenterica DSM 1558]|uniref:uncharacterized protein n=1 Tax=Tremella mesenterica (strain ATCC 24925 / CBS 8224 / DSM 1558 / NBRC 9311 / NRRL Y-6157 / RJB 2259-6 / UBC 559-6) TaxID=578456 RepID=UPI0003F48FBA|nr:uncharacterized protein TREMEDRAFT_64184 [Tremella mesenterica DSM 1558]EIW67591.1 hypothetical protein TREMEDRAFT_64184 [Tremella mesenterica DSM 1558]
MGIEGQAGSTGSSSDEEPLQLVSLYPKEDTVKEFTQNLESFLQFYVDYSRVLIQKAKTINDTNITENSEEVVMTDRVGDNQDTQDTSLIQAGSLPLMSADVGCIGTFVLFKQMLFSSDLDFTQEFPKYGAKHLVGIMTDNVKKYGEWTATAGLEKNHELLLQDMNKVIENGIEIIGQSPKLTDEQLSKAYDSVTNATYTIGILKSFPDCPDPSEEYTDQFQKVNQAVQEANETMQTLISDAASFQREKQGKSFSTLFGPKTSHDYALPGGSMTQETGESTMMLYNGRFPGDQESVPPSGWATGQNNRFESLINARRSMSTNKGYDVLGDEEERE